jgi:hypothetical protein
MPNNSVEKIKSLKTIRGKDLKVRYTQDDFEDALINQRLYYDENGDILTPITSLLLARQVTPSNPTIDRLGNSEPRYILACFGSPSNQSGESQFKSIIPYSPGDLSHIAHIKEIIDYVSLSQFLEPKMPLAMIYHGESYNH